jgi:DNA polymerase-3 subunit delta'
MLKTIEEPPAYAVILILTSNREVFLPTIRSRCVELSMQPVSDENVVKCLTKRGFHLDVNQDEVLRFACGNIGRAIAYLEDEDYQKMMQDIQQVLYTLPDASSAQIKRDVEQLAAYKGQMSVVMEQFRMWFRDIFLCKAGAVPEHRGAGAGFIRNQAERYRYEDLQRILQEIEQFQSRLKVNVNLELSMEVLLFGLQPEKQG